MILALIQARMGSTRLPGKSLTDVAGRPLLGWVVRAAQAIPGVDRVAVATSDASEDDALATWCAGAGIGCHRGSAEDVLDRFASAVRAESADVVLRITGDCPLLDPQVCGQVLRLLLASDADYASNQEPCGWPDGLDCEAVRASALLAAAAETTRPFDREHVTPFLRNNRDRFAVVQLPCPLPGLAQERWTVDTSSDLEFLRAVVAELPADRVPSHLDVLALLARKPALRALNAQHTRNEGSGTSRIAEGAPPARGHRRSGELLERALKVIPLGTQTFSKCHEQFPAGHAPLFLTHGQGARVWDVDGNEYVDMVSALLPITLGYCDPDVNDAIARQLGSGISFSLATELETDLAERLVEIIPCAEMARFAKNGSDVTSACVRVARAETGRDRVAVCGYHGWQDWYIGSTTRNRGVPETVSRLTHRFVYNDLDSLRALFREHPGEFAAVVMEPVNAVRPAEGFLQGVCDLAHEHGALFVFDEVITGFRMSLGGAQELFGVVPDLASFGKGMGNGMPISAIVGKAKYMHQLEHVFFSGTFGGEALSLAAAIAVIDKMRREPVIETLWRTGERVGAAARAAIEKHRVSDLLSLQGLPPWTILAFTGRGDVSAEAVKTFFIRGMLEQGVLIASSHGISYAHGPSELDRLTRAYDHVLGHLADEVGRPGFESRLGCPVIRPVFKVR